MNYNKKYQEELFKAVCLSSNIEIVYTGMKKNKSKDVPKLPVSDKGLKAFYEQINSIDLKWLFKDNPDIGGNIKLLESKYLYDNAIQNPAEFAVINGDFNYAKEIGLQGAFHPVNLNTNECSIGFFEDSKLCNELFVFEAGYHFYSLQIGFEEYFELLCASKGFVYWEKAILNYLYPSYESGNLADFKYYMPKIFPKWEFNEFIRLFDKIHLQFQKQKK
jgi:hypothetical protein